MAVKNEKFGKSVKGKFRQAGMTLTESLLVLGIGAAVAVLAYGGYKMATGMVSASSQVRGITQLAAGIQRVFGVAGNYADVSAANVINSRIVPSDFKVGGGVITHAWGNSVVPQPGNQVGAGTTQFRITINGVPQNVCVDFLSGISSAATTLWAGGTTAGTHDVKDSTGTYYPARAATQCGSSATTNVILVAG